METGIEPEFLELEITESTIMKNVDRAVEMLRELKSLGVRLSVDDFGTGHSGLAHLQRYPISTLKIDRAFIERMLGSAQSMEIVRSSIGLAHSLGMNVVAEGVETEAVREKLLELGCDFGQGWHFGMPAALADFGLVRAEI